jgi:hypothetical protein
MDAGAEERKGDDAKVARREHHPVSVRETINAWKREHERACANTFHKTPAHQDNHRK